MNNYLFDTGKGVIAMDTGYPGGLEKFIRRFERRWPLSQLKFVFLSHHHDDHAGFLNDLLRISDAQVILHEKAVALIEAGSIFEPEGSGFSSVPASWFGMIKNTYTYPNVILNGRAIPLQSELDQVFFQMGLPIQILFLPGHTGDSIALYLPETGDLYCADAAMNAIISVARHTIWIDDAYAYGESWDKMLSLNPKRIIPAHGRPFPPKDLAKFRNYLDGRKLININK